MLYLRLEGLQCVIAELASIQIKRAFFSWDMKRENSRTKVPNKQPLHPRVLPQWESMNPHSDQESSNCSWCLIITKGCGWEIFFFFVYSSSVFPQPWMLLFSSDRFSDPGLSFPKEPCSVLGSIPAFDIEDNIYCSGRKSSFFFSTPTWTDLVGFEALKKKNIAKCP